MFIRASMPALYEPVHMPFLGPNVLRKRLHYLTLYASAAQLVERICAFLRPAVQPGHAGVVVATPEHLKLLRERGSQYGIDVAAEEECGRLLLLDAHEMMRKIIVDGMPLAHLFEQHLVPVLELVASSHLRLHVYGEMVDVLMQQGNARAAWELEFLWNELGRKRTFSLLCGYREGSLGEHHDNVCSAHTHLVTDEEVIPVLA